MTTDWKPLIVRLTPQQYAKLKQLSTDQDRSMSATIRRLIDRAIP